MIRALFSLIIICSFTMPVYAQTLTASWSDTEIVEAIYQAEGGIKATYLYGIRSVSYDTPEEARRICFNTVRNNHKRYAKYGYKTHKTYLEFLASRYCPINADNDPTNLNINWISNVKYFLTNPRVGMVLID